MFYCFNAELVTVFLPYAIVNICIDNCYYFDSFTFYFSKSSLVRIEICKGIKKIFNYSCVETEHNGSQPFRAEFFLRKKIMKYNEAVGSKLALNIRIPSRLRQGS